MKKDSYLDENGNYVYTRMVLNRNGKGERQIIDIVPLTAENKECIIVLSENDHAVELAERYDAEHEDYKFLAKKKADYDPFDTIAAPVSKEETENSMMEQILAFIETLTPSQKDLIYEHLGASKQLEEIRREEEEKTGKKITKQAMHNRWNKIIIKACKYFGVEKPKQIHRKKG